MSGAIAPVHWEHDRLVLLDQRLLPAQELERVYGRWEDVADAIRTLAVRGAPAIGVAAAFGLVLAARTSTATTFDALVADLEVARKGLAATRPTAVNLFWALDRMRRAVEALRERPLDQARARLLGEAQAILDEDLEANRALGDHGAALVPAQRAHPDALQRRRARHGRLRHRARRGALGPRAGQGGVAMGGRDAAGHAGLPTHRLGVRARGHPAPAHRRRRGRLRDGRG